MFITFPLIVFWPTTQCSILHAISPYSWCDRPFPRMVFGYLSGLSTIATNRWLTMFIKNCFICLLWCRSNMFYVNNGISSSLWFCFTYIGLDLALAAVFIALYFAIPLWQARSPKTNYVHKQCNQYPTTMVIQDFHEIF